MRWQSYRKWAYVETGCGNGKFWTPNDDSAAFTQSGTEFGIPFEFVGMDYFGPIKIKGRGDWEVMGACKVVCNPPRVYAWFIGILMRFVGRRGRQAHICRGNGTKFVGAVMVSPQGTNQKWTDESCPKLTTWTLTCLTLNTLNRLGNSCLTCDKDVLPIDNLSIKMIKIEGIITRRTVLYPSSERHDNMPLISRNICRFRKPRLQYPWTQPIEGRNWTWI